MENVYIPGHCPMCAQEALVMNMETGIVECEACTEEMKPQSKEMEQLNKELDSIIIVD